MKTMVNLGSEFYVKAKMYEALFHYSNWCSPDTSRVFVNIGLGFHLEFTVNEAVSFIEEKEKQLNKYFHEYLLVLTDFRNAEELTTKASAIKAKIKLVFISSNFILFLLSYYFADVSRYC
jgi:prefoldin subunit 5